MKKNDYQSELNQLYIEFEKVEKMNELEACEYGACDSKQGYLEAIQEEINYYENQIKELEKAEELEENNDWRISGLDPAFGSWYEFNQYMYGWV